MTSASLGSNATVSFTGSGSSVRNDGLIDSAHGQAVIMDGTGGHLINHGTIRADDEAVSLLNFAGTVRNSGEITSASGVAITLTPFATATVNHLFNSGSISGMKTAIVGSGGIEFIVNRGEINGDVSLGGNNDIFDGRNGTVVGIVDGGDGNDLITGGISDDTLVGGTGKDILRGKAGSDVLQGGVGSDQLSGERMTTLLSSPPSTMPEKALMAMSFLILPRELSDRPEPDRRQHQRRRQPGFHFRDRCIYGRRTDSLHRGNPYSRRQCECQPRGGFPDHMKRSRQCQRLIFFCRTPLTSKRVAGNWPRRWHLRVALRASSPAIIALNCLFRVSQA